jgi:hypothetical protein
MPQRLLRVAIVASFLFGFSSRASAAPILIDFEGLNSLDDVGAAFGPLVTFTGATVLTAGVSLNENDFPPHSGSNVVFDSGSIRLDFADTVSNFSGYFTYIAPVVLQFFDASNNLLGSVSSQFAANYVGGGGTPNELITGAFTGISYLTISGDPSGGSFILDDVGFETSDGTPPPVPEPSTLLLLGSGAIALLRVRRSRRAQQQ